MVSYRHFKDADELASLVADDLALLLTERFVTPSAAPPVAPLPAPRSPLVDRVEELQVVTGLLPAARLTAGLVTLTGPARRRLETTLAPRPAPRDTVADQFAGRRLDFVSLEALTDNSLIRQTVARQLHVPPFRRASRSRRACARFLVPAGCSCSSTARRAAAGRGSAAHQAGARAGARAEGAGRQP